MAAGRSYYNELSLMVRQLGLWSQLDEDAHRQLRLVCRALHVEADTLIDTLTLRLDSAACSSPAAAQRMAAFHRRCTAAQTLLVYAPGRAPVTIDTARFAEAYARAAGPLVAVQQCRVSGAGCGRYHVATLRSLLDALPQLQGLCLMAPGSGELSGLQHASPRSAAQLVSVLSDCAQLHSLALDCSPRALDGHRSEGILSALPQLTQLRALSLTGSIFCRHLSYLTRLTRLERLGVQGLLGERGLLPSVHMLSAPWTDPLPPPPQPACSSGSISLDPQGGAYMEPGALRALPNLTRLEHISIRLLPKDDLSAANLPALVQRFAGCADMWRLSISPRVGLFNRLELPVLKEQLPPGSLAPLRHLWIGCRGMLAHQWSALMQLLLAAAPNVRSLGSYDMDFMTALANEQTLLQPLKHAAQLQMLVISTHDATADAPQLAAVVRHLAAQPQEPRGGEAHCAVLRCVRMWHTAGDGVVDAAAALLERSGCTIRLQRLE